MKWKKYRTGDVLDFNSSNGIFHACNVSIEDNKTESNHPYVVRTSQNNGIRGYISEDESKLNPANTISFAQDTAQMFYQSEPYFTGNKVKVLSVKGHALTENIATFLITCMNKAFSNFAWGSSYDTKLLQNVMLSLPVKIKYIPDFNLMSEIIGGGISMSNIDTSSWKEFRLVDIAKLDNGNKMDKNKMTHLNPSVNFVSRTATNNGVSDVVDIVDGIEPYPAGCITLAFGGSVGSCFLQEEPFYTGQNVGVISLPDNITREAKIFLVSALEKKCKMSFHAFGNEINKHFKTDLSIKLPVKESEEIDWEYMQERIIELEQERITELEQYLIATGLNDYELTNEDKDILATKLTDGGILQNSISGNGCLKEARMFRVGDLFELQKVSNKLVKENLSDDYDYPAYSSDTSNNGIIGYTNKPEFICNDDVPVYIIFGDHTRTLNIARKSFSVLDNVKVLIPCCDNDKVLLYITSKWQKQIPNLGYARHWKMAKNCVLSLPIQTDANNKPIIDETHTYHPDGYIPDWTYMEKYIRAIEKVVIKDVVDYKDSIIAKTKEIVA